jgi:hypothetical protein
MDGRAHARPAEVGSRATPDACAAPDAFANIAAGDRIVTANRVALEACQKRANKADETVPCTVRIAPAAKR